MRFATDAVHAGQAPERVTGAVMVPVFQTSTYAQDGIGQHRGYEYARTQNPTREALEACVAALEKASHGVAFGSGMVAIHALLQTKTNQLVDSLEMASVKFLNAVTERQLKAAGA